MRLPEFQNRVAIAYADTFFEAKKKMDGVVLHFGASSSYTEKYCNISLCTSRRRLIYKKNQIKY